MREASKGKEEANDVYTPLHFSPLPSPTSLAADTRRDSIKDKIILEEAYRANPKPDKKTRRTIVDRVSLNEKEVQVRLTLYIDVAYLSRQASHQPALTFS